MHFCVRHDLHSWRVFLPLVTNQHLLIILVWLLFFEGMPTMTIQVLQRNWKNLAHNFQVICLSTCWIPLQATRHHYVRIGCDIAYILRFKVYPDSFSMFVISFCDTVIARLLKNSFFVVNGISLNLSQLSIYSYG